MTTLRHKLQLIELRKCIQIVQSLLNQVSKGSDITHFLYMFTPKILPLAVHPRPYSTFPHDLNLDFIFQTRLKPLSNPFVGAPYIPR